MRRILLPSVLLLVCAASLPADVVTLPAAASIHGGNPFFSDARVFNTSYSASLSVTGTYRCFIATVACPATAPEIHFTLAPRESRSFDDICAGAFGAPNTAGGVEFEFTGSEDQLVVTSRLFSIAPFNSVGMFIPGLSASKAHPVTVLTSIRHDPATSPPSGFRTNAGVFNPGSSSADVTFTIFDAGAKVGSAVARTVPGHSGAQVSGIFEAAGLDSLSTRNATIVVSASSSVFGYAAVLDNRTADPIFVVGAPDQTAPPATATTKTVHVGRGGTFFVDDESGTSVTTIQVGDTVKWVWEGTLNHGTAAGSCSGGGGGGYDPSACTPSGTWDSNIHTTPYSYSYTFPSAGTFHYFCDVHLNAMTGRVVVNAPAASAKTQGASARR
jgi:plastocyanin